MVQSTNMLNPYPQQGGANAVAINIYNPQAYGAPATQQQIKTTEKGQGGTSLVLL